MRTMYLHVGLPKTASTFLQTKLFSSLSHMRVISMPPGGHFADARNDRLVAEILRRSATIWDHHADPLFDDLLGQDWRRNTRDILLSDEAIGRTASRQSLLAAHMRALKAALCERGIARLKMLCPIRRQDHWLISHYVQVSDRQNNAGQADFEALVRQIGDPRHSRFTFGALLDYASTYTALAGAIGAENLTMVPMEWLRADGAAMQHAIADWLDMPAAEIGLAQRETANVRATGDGRWQLRPRSRLHRLAQAVLHRPREVSLDVGISSAILRVYETCNTRLATMTGLDLRSLGYSTRTDDHEKDDGRGRTSRVSSARQFR